MSADFEPTNYSAEIREHTHEADLLEDVADVAFSSALYSADLNASDLP